MRALVAPIVLIVAVLGSILAGVATPTEAAGVGAIGATLLAGERMVAGRPLPIYVAALSLVGLLVLTSFVDLRIARSTVSSADQARHRSRRAAVRAASPSVSWLRCGAPIAMARSSR